MNRQEFFEWLNTCPGDLTIESEDVGASAVKFSYKEEIAEEIEEEEEYSLVWRIELRADSPADAAKRAHAIHLDPTSEAVSFEVTGPDGVTTFVDLMDEGVPSF